MRATRYVEQFPVVNAKLDRAQAEGPTLTTADRDRVRSRVLVMIGDDDEATLEHAIMLMYWSLPDGELAVVPTSSHGLLVEKPTLCNTIIVDFLTTDPERTMAPIRRA